MNIQVTPEPSPEERRAILAAFDQTNARPTPYDSRWRASALSDLRDGALAEDAGSDPGVVEA
jgi:hypothetical protein